MAYFPQINSSKIITQLPYASAQAYETVVQDMETGMRFSFPRRAVGLSGYPSGPLHRFGVNFSTITDAEVSDLYTFFKAMGGRWGSFRFLDPGGNLLQYSEDFSQAAWDKSNGPVTLGAAVADPFGGNLARALVAGSGNSFMMAVVGASDGLMNGVRVTVSVWVNAQDAGAQLFLGFVDSGFSQLDGTTWSLPLYSWKRIHHSVTLWSNNYFRVIMGGFGTWSGGKQIHTFGFQTSPMKGEGAYARTPGNYGYHESCRFDTDVFERKVIGPNQSSLVLPIVEFNP